MNRNCANGIINFCNLIKELYRQHNQKTANNTDYSRTDRRNHITASSNTNQSCQRRIECHGDIRLSITDPSEDQRCNACDGSSHIGIEEYQTCRYNGLIAVHSNCGAAVKPKPAEPKNEYAKCGNG